MRFCDAGYCIVGASRTDRGMANAEAAKTVVVHLVRRHLQKDEINNNIHEQNGEHQIKAK